ncbi:MAG: S8 family serine peptidase, partial [bacterium]|nr:S8 family serine peptidase [bacterium]
MISTRWLRDDRGGLKAAATRAMWVRHRSGDLQVATVLKAAATCVVLFTFALPAFALTPSDPLYSQQWYLDRISAPAAWDVVSGNPSSVVAVLDVGVDLDHPDLTSAIWANSGEVAGNGIDDDRNGYIDDVRGWDFVDGDADPSPEYDIAGSNPRDLHHGTLVAGIIAAKGDGKDAPRGLAPGVKILPVKVVADATGTASGPTVAIG